MSVLARIEVESVGEGTISDGEFMSITTDPHATGRTFYGYVSSMENIDNKVAPGNSTPVLVHRGAHFRRPHERRFVTIVYSGMGRVTMNANIRSPIPVMGPVYLDENKDSTFISDTLGTLVGYALHAIRPSDDQVTADILLSFSREESFDKTPPLILGKDESDTTVIIDVPYSSDLYGQVFVGDFYNEEGFLTDGPEHKKHEIVHNLISEGHFDVTSNDNTTVEAAINDLISKLPDESGIDADNIKTYIDPTVLQRAAMQERNIESGNTVSVVKTSALPGTLSGAKPPYGLIHGTKRTTIIEIKAESDQQLDDKTKRAIGKSLSFGSYAQYSTRQNELIEEFYYANLKLDAARMGTVTAEANLLNAYRTSVESTDSAGTPLYFVGFPSVLELVEVTGQRVKVRDRSRHTPFEVGLDKVFKKT